MGIWQKRGFEAEEHGRATATTASFTEVKRLRVRVVFLRLRAFVFLMGVEALRKL